MKEIITEIIKYIIPLIDRTFLSIWMLLFTAALIAIPYLCFKFALNITIWLLIAFCFTFPLTHVILVIALYTTTAYTHWREKRFQIKRKQQIEAFTAKQAREKSYQNILWAIKFHIYNEQSGAVDMRIGDFRAADLELDCTLFMNSGLIERLQEDLPEYKIVRRNHNDIPGLYISWSCAR